MPILQQRQEATDVLHFLLPQLESVDVPIVNIKTDATTSKTGSLRGDVWISREQFLSPNWESEIVALIEAKPPFVLPNTSQWKDAVRQGRAKAIKQGLPYFVVTNTDKFWRYYRTYDEAIIKIDGQEIYRPLGIKDLEILLTQVSPTCDDVVRAIAPASRSYSKKEFQAALWQVKNVYRNCAIGNSDSKIYTTITMIVLKYICEQERIRRTLPKDVLLWDEWRDSHMDRDIKASIEDIQRSGAYSGVASELSIAKELQASHCREIHTQLGRFQFSGCNFDLYGAVYESFADPKTKREFGEFFTSRHITAVLSELLLRGELRPRGTPLSICDPACGTGGFLTEAYRVLLRNYQASGMLTNHTMRQLREETFYGFDIKDRNISLARINMCLAGDGHTNIEHTADSLMTLPEDAYDYVLTNVPYGVYTGMAGNEFKWAKQSRYETLFVEKIVRSLRPRGHAVIIVPDGILESPSLESYRQHLLHETRIEAVISLHPYVFRPYTSEKTYALILEKLPPSERGKRSSVPVFMYILENDGFQKGDKRYPIQENDIPDLRANYLSDNARAPHVLLHPSKINASNFHNLLPEFHLDYYEHEYRDASMEEYRALIERIQDLSRTVKDFSA